MAACNEQMQSLTNQSMAGTGKTEMTARDSAQWAIASRRSSRRSDLQTTERANSLGRLGMLAWEGMIALPQGRPEYASDCLAVLHSSLG